MTKIKICPSILSADFAYLADEAEKMKRSGADMLHVDVMDGHFVPNISLGIPIVKSLSKVTDLELDVHLMISDPLKYLKQFSDAGADSITFHLEAEKNLDKCIKEIRKLGIKCGVSIKPGTSASQLKPYLDDIDLVLIMTVEPGFGGQEFMPAMLDKVRWLKEIKPDLLIQVDGGINESTAKEAIDAGASLLVAGSYVFGSNDPKKAIDSLRRA